jgi:hypothetical protein
MLALLRPRACSRAGREPLVSPLIGGCMVQPEWLAGHPQRKPGAGSSAEGPPAGCPSCPSAPAAAAAARPAGAGTWAWGRKVGGGGGRRTEESERCTRPSAGMRISMSSATLRRLIEEELRSRRRLQQRGDAGRAGGVWCCWRKKGKLSHSTA